MVRVINAGKTNPRKPEQTRRKKMIRKTIFAAVAAATVSAAAMGATATSANAGFSLNLYGYGPAVYHAPY